MKKRSSIGCLVLSVLAFQAAGLAVVGGAYWGKQNGYFYSTSERVALFEKLPDANAARMLSLIYADQPQLPEMTLVRYVLNPGLEDPGMQELLKDPGWAHDYRRVSSLQFDPALAELASKWSIQSFEQLLARSDQGRALSPTQRRILDTCRESALKAMLRQAPEDDQQTRLLCTQAETILTRPWRLRRTWYDFIRGASGQQQFYVLKELEKTSEPDRQFSLLRQVRLLAKIGQVEGGNYHTVRRLAAQARQNVIAGRQPEHNLKLLAHYQKLDPWVKPNNQKLSLTPAQKKILDTDPWQ